MKAIVYSKYGPPDVVRLEDVTVPVPRQGEVLLRLVATGVNSSDLEFREPGVRARLGSDQAEAPSARL